MSDALKKAENETADPKPLTDEEAAKATGGTKVLARRVKRNLRRAAAPGRTPAAGAENPFDSSSDTVMNPEEFPGCAK